MEFQVVKDGRTIQIYKQGFIIGELGKVNNEFRVIALNTYQMTSQELYEISEKLVALNNSLIEKKKHIPNSFTIVECKEKECLNRNEKGFCTLTQIKLSDDDSPILGRMLCKNVESNKVGRSQGT
jgi:hypothetical protein